MFSTSCLKPNVEKMLVPRAPAELMIAVIVHAHQLRFFRTLEHVNDRHFIDNLETEYADNGDGLVPDVPDFVGQYTTRTGYPVVRVAYTQGLGVTLIQVKIIYQKNHY